MRSIARHEEWAPVHLLFVWEFVFADPTFVVEDAGDDETHKHDGERNRLHANVDKPGEGRGGEGRESGFCL